jgi:hypothetical protein
VSELRDDVVAGWEGTGADGGETFSIPNVTVGRWARRR